MSLPLSAVQFYRDEVKKVMPSKSFSEMIKILENFLSFLDFAVSFIALQVYSVIARQYQQVYRIVGKFGEQYIYLAKYLILAFGGLPITMMQSLA